MFVYNVSSLVDTCVIILCMHAHLYITIWITFFKDIKIKGNACFDNQEFNEYTDVHIFCDGESLFEPVLKGITWQLLALTGALIVIVVQKVHKAAATFWDIWYMMIYDDLWWSMMIYDVLWCSLMFYDVLCLKSILGFRN